MQVLSLLAEWRITPVIYDRPDLVSIMVRAARDSGSFSVRAMALKILGLQQQLTDEVLDVLFGSLQASPFTDQGDVREAAAASMAEYKYFPLKSFDRLIASLDSPNPAVIQTAIQIILELGRGRSEELGGAGRNSLADGLYRCLRGHTGYELYPGFYEEIYNALFCVVSGSLPRLEHASAPEQAGPEGGLVARYLTTYSVGDDLYDDSFSIDSPSGEFLGECGVGISNTVGAGDPKKVNALDVWLFDKNDIQTMTHVYLTDAAVTDASVRRILEGKGELHLIRNHARSVLRTATLEMRVEVVDFEYLQDPGLSYHSAVGKITYAIDVFSR